MEDAKGKHFCGGALISGKKIATAKHCFKEAIEHNRTRPFTAVFFKDKKSGKEEKKERIKIDLYIYPINSDDHAFVLLEHAAPSTPIDVCKGELRNGTKAFLLRWRFVDYNKDAKYLNKVDLEISHYEGFKLFTELPTSSGQIVDACPGDSGGPLVAGSGSGQCLAATVDGGGYGCKEPYPASSMYGRWNSMNILQETDPKNYVVVHLM